MRRIPSFVSLLKAKQCLLLLFIFFQGTFVYSQSSLISDEKIKEAKSFCKKNNLNTRYCFMLDFSLHSGKKRFFVYDFIQNKICYSGLVCHGAGKNSSGSNPVYSNEYGSNCSSLGKYKTGARAYSKWGINVHYKLHGLEKSNSNAFKRTVVLHSYDLVPQFEIYPMHLVMGWSLGCPVVNNSLMKKLDEMLKKTDKATLLWIYN